MPDRKMSVLDSELTEMSQFSDKLIKFILIITTAGLAFLALFLLNLDLKDDKLIGLFIFVPIAILTHCKQIRLPAGEQTFTLSPVVNFAAFLIFGPEVAAVIAFSGTFLGCRMEKLPYCISLFNAAKDVLAIVNTTIACNTIGNHHLALVVMALTYVLTDEGISITASCLLGKSKLYRTKDAGPVEMLLTTISQTWKYYFIIFAGTILWTIFWQNNSWLLALLTILIIDAYYGIHFFNALMAATFDILLTLAEALALRDGYTGGHNLRVANMAVKVALRLNLPIIRVYMVLFAAIIHDIGKIIVPDKILRKPGFLEPDERKVMQGHVCDNLIPQLSKFFMMIDKIRKAHHEEPSGKGYPEALEGEAVPIEAQCIAVVDVFDAVTSKRPYNQPKPPEVAINQILLDTNRTYGKQLAKEVVDAFVGLYQEGKIYDQDGKISTDIGWLMNKKMREARIGFNHLTLHIASLLTIVLLVILTWNSPHVWSNLLLIPFVFGIAYHIKQYQELHATVEGIYFNLAEEVALRSGYDRQYPHLAAEYAGKLAGKLGIWGWRLQMIKRGTALCNIGNINIEDRLLQKQGQLTPEEFELVKRHVLLQFHDKTHIFFQGEIVDRIIYSHHERYDGLQGSYPGEKKGEEIPLEARIAAVVEVYLAMSLGRNNRDPLLYEQIREKLQMMAGNKLDPDITVTFLEIIEEEERNREKIHNLIVHHIIDRFYF